MTTVVKPTPSPIVHLETNWKTIMSMAAVEVFDMMAGVHLEVNPGSTEEQPGGHTAIVGMAGALCGMTTLRCSRATSAKLAGLMLGGNSSSIPSHARDALGELCNMVAGNFKERVSTLGARCLLSVPLVITGSDYSVEPADQTDRFTLALSFDGKLVWVSLFAHS